MHAEQKNRDAVARRQRLAMTPAERLALFVHIQQACMTELRASPEGWNRFLRRNIRQRAVRSV